MAIGKIIASALCIGTGGSAGREGPIVQVGSTLGSSIGQWLRLSDERIKNLVACGAASGIAATFNAPIAGVVFAIEVLVSELHASIFGNVVVAAVSASIISQMLLGAQPAFAVPAYELHSSWEMFFYVALGLTAPFVAIMFIRMLDFAENFFDGKKWPASLKPAVGALCLGTLGFFYLQLPAISYTTVKEFQLDMPLIENIPHMYGSGFTFIEEVLHGQRSFLLVVLLIFLKPLATSFTLGSGNSGGVFAPSLFLGAMFGASFGMVVNYLFPTIAVTPGAYALVGMASVFAAAAHAPLTAMLIVFEMSNDYHLILPLMTASIIATLISQWLHPDSIYSIKLTKRGIRLEQGHDMDIMQGVTVSEVMIPEPVIARTTQSVADLFALIQKTHMQGFPVVDDNRELHGFITLRDIEVSLDNEKKSLQDIQVGEICSKEPVTIYPDQPVYMAIRKMSPRDLARLPVVSRENPKKIIGLVRRNDIVRSYEVGLMRRQQAQHFRDLMALRQVTGLECVDMTVQQGSPLDGRLLADAKLPQEVNIISVTRHALVLVPTGKTRLLAEDRLTVLGEKQALRLLEPLCKNR